MLNLSSKCSNNNTTTKVITRGTATRCRRNRRYNTSHWGTFPSTNSFVTTFQKLQVFVLVPIVVFLAGCTQTFTLLPTVTSFQIKSKFLTTSDKVPHPPNNNCGSVSGSSRSRSRSSSTKMVSTTAPSLSSSNSKNKKQQPQQLQQQKKDMIQDDAAVLRELKEIIRKQANEIKLLKQQQSPGAIAATETTAVAASTSHHGGGEAITMEEIATYLYQPSNKLATKRVGWLSIFLVSLSLTAVIMNGFEHTLSKQIELAYFVPLLAGHGGNTGGQTVGTVLSAFSAGSITLKDAPAVIMKEATAGLIVGIILGSAVAPVSHYLMGISMHVSVVMLCTLPLVSTLAAALGSSIPFLCLWLGLDPSVIAAPAMTSFVDITGLLSYFMIANYIFHLFGIEL